MKLAVSEQPSDHTHRFALHHTFMYLMYDVLRLRKSALGYGFLAKRADWDRIQSDLNSLTPDRIQAAIDACRNHQMSDDPAIKSLMYSLRSVGTYEPHSFADKLRKRAEMKGLLVLLGMAALWLTLNPSDLRNPLVLHLAGLPFSHDSLPNATATLRKIAVTSNPVAIALFFHYICEAFFENLLRSNSDELGILGNVAGHYGVVETNGRGMLHLHSLIWLSGNFTFDNIRARVLNDSEFKQRLIFFLESIIVNTVNQALTDTDILSRHDIPPFPSDLTDEEFLRQLHVDSHSVADKFQRHSSSHNATCFKYGKKSKCRFGMPRELVPVSYGDEFGVVHVKRDDPWITSYNPAIATCFRSNHDVTWIPTNAKAHAYIYYLTNYATKADLSPQQILIKTALMVESRKSILADQGSSSNQTSQDPKFLLRWYNSLAHDQEISGVQIASTLLKLPSHYTNFTKFVNVNLSTLRSCIRALLHSGTGSNDILAAETCFMHVNGRKAFNRLDNYRFRGHILGDFCFFEYCMLVRPCRMQESVSNDCQYDSQHPKYSTQIQRLAKSRSQMRTVCYHGQLSQCQNEEEQVRRGHPTTLAIRNDLAEILLAFFVPWHQIVPLFNTYCSGLSVENDAYSRLWTIVEPTLAPPLRQYARNFTLLQKSKEEAEIDKALREWEDNLQNTDDFDAISDIDDTEDTLEQDADFSSHVKTESLIAACHHIATGWHKEGFTLVNRFPALNTTWSLSYDIQEKHLTPLDISRLAGCESSGLRFLSEDITRQWEARLKNHFSTDDDDSSVDSNEEIQNSYLNDTEDYGLQPALYSDNNRGSPADTHFLHDDNLSASTLLQAISQELPLNRKQHLIAWKIIDEALSWKDYPYDSSKRDQMFAYLGGEGGTGKSFVVRALKAVLTLLQREHEIIVTAPTGCAADNIDGNTYHTALGLSFDNQPRKSPLRRIQRLWSNKTIMVIDEVSMVDLQTLAKINRQCNIARSLSAQSSELFGDMPVILFMGDFYQFPPVRGLPLWRQPRDNKEDEQTGRDIWHRFTNVVILDEQMRQTDPQLRALLTRARNAQLTTDDLLLLNSKVITKSQAFEFHSMVSIVRLNSVRHPLTHLSMISFARQLNQFIFLFPGDHSRLPSSERLCLDTILAQQDEGVKIPFPGLFLYTPGMPCMVLANVSSRWSLVNGSRGIAAGIIMEPNSKIWNLFSTFTRNNY